MPAIVTGVDCVECEGKHDFYAEPGFSMSGTYEYTCPKTKKTATLKVPAATNFVNAAPEGAVLATRSDIQPI